jgi:hypothetical protein
MNGTKSNKIWNYQLIQLMHYFITNENSSKERGCEPQRDEYCYKEDSCLS